MTGRPVLSKHMTAVEGAAVTGTDRIAYYSYSLDASVDVPGQEDIFTVDPATGDVQRLTDDSRSLDFISDRNPVWSPDRGVLAIHRSVSDQLPHLCVVDARTGETRADLGEGHTPVWLDDDVLLHSSTERYHVVVATRVSTGEQRQVLVLPEGSDVEGMSWHDGAGLAFGYADETPWWRIGCLPADVVRAAVDGGEPAPADGVILYGRPGVSLALPDWDPRGERLCVSQMVPSGDPSQARVVILDPRAGTYVEVPRGDDDLTDIDGSWSPDGQSIVYVRSHGVEWSELWLYDVAAGTTRQLTDDNRLRAKGSPDW